MSATELGAEWPDATLMVVDDEDLICRMLARVLERRGYQRVRTFTDPQAALDDYDALRPDLVLLDLHMPQLDGVTLLRRIMDRPVHARAQVIIMTGAGRVEDAYHTLGLGAADFLHKPIDTTELLLRVRYQLRERRLRLQLAAQNDQLEALVQARAGELALLSRVLDEMPLPAFVLTEQLDLHYANARGQRILDGAEGGLLDVLAVTADRRSRIAATIREVTAEPQRIPLVVRWPNGTQRRADVQAQRVESGYIALLLHDVEEQERAKEVLHRALERERQSVEEMRGLEALRTNFLTAVSHELRTPLTVVLGIAELLRRREGEFDAGQRTELLGRLEGNASRLGELLEDLLDLNRLSEGQPTLDLERTDLAGLVGSVLEEVTGDITHPVRSELHACEVEVEAATMRRVVSNLVRNATVHTPPGTSITVRVAPREGQVRFTVEDQGPGVPDRFKGRIFERFEQGDSTPSHRPGTGIGLTLVRDFVELHGGAVWVEDTPGGGATFVVELPAAS